MSRIRPQEGMQIAALKKKQQTVFDPMVAGTGTPWEDRGTHGTVGAFFKTCFASMSAPGKLMGSIRRPETITDAKGFLIGISAIWGVCAVIHMAIKLWLASRLPNVVEDGVDLTACGVFCALAAALGGGGTYFFYSTYVNIYGKLVSQEKDAVLMPQVLIYNVNVYAFGPSLLALIPLIGPPIALIWIFCNLVVAGTSRLKLRFSAALIDALLSFLSMLAIIGGIWLVGWLLLDYLGTYSAITLKQPPKLLQHGQ